MSHSYFKLCLSTNYHVIINTENTHYFLAGRIVQRNTFQALHPPTLHNIESSPVSGEETFCLET